MRITLPAAPEYSRMVEIAAVHAATHLGFSATDVADLSLAIKEAVQLMLDPAQPGGRMEFDFMSKAGIVTVEAHLEHQAAKAISHQRIDRFESTVGSLVDSWKLDPDDNHLWLQKTANGLTQR